MKLYLKLDASLDSFRHQGTMESSLSWKLDDMGGVGMKSVRSPNMEEGTPSGKEDETFGMGKNEDEIFGLGMTMATSVATAVLLRAAGVEAAIGIGEVAVVMAVAT